MQVEMSLAELLINAIAGGRIRGVQFKRGYSEEKATWDDLQSVVQNRLEDALTVARESGHREAQDHRRELDKRVADREVEMVVGMLTDLLGEKFWDDVSEPARSTAAKSLDTLIVAFRSGAHRELAERKYQASKRGSP